MERTALARAPPPRAARKSEWLQSALAHHHCPDPGAENEIVVLATGIDQYLQEVFHHLAYPNQDDAVSAEDFTALCAVLGLTGGGKGKAAAAAAAAAAANGKEGAKDEADDEEFRDVCSGLPCKLSFKEFHARLCEYFRVRSARRGAGECAWRLPVTEDTELVERQIQLRWPRVRRRKCVSFDLTKDNKSGAGNRTGKGRTPEARGPDEAAALRELVEDLRSALQGSDARCLALEVALRREKSVAPLPSPRLGPAAAPPAKSSITFVQGKLVPTQRLRGQRGGSVGDGARRALRRRDIRDPLLRELKLIRAGRDGQLEEAIRFNERLEEELQWAYREARKLQGVESALRNENNQIRRRAEEAREALSLGLQRVRMIQEQAQSVPKLQATISRLERELQQYRTCCSCGITPAGQQSNPEEKCNKDAECLQRAVEGKAASDEEEEEQGAREEGECRLAEVKRHTGQLHACGKGCQSHKVPHVLAQTHVHSKTNTSKDSRGRCSCMAANQKLAEGDGCSDKQAEEEEGRTKLQERTCRSLVEDKLAHSLTLLMQLRNKNVSRSVLGKVVMDTLDVCSRGGDGPAQVLRVAEALTARLSSGDLLADRGPDDGRGGGNEGGGGGESEEKLLISPSGRPTSSVNPLLISC